MQIKKSFCHCHYIDSKFASCISIHFYKERFNK